jgi:hypothetical protein
MLRIVVGVQQFMTEFSGAVSKEQEILANKELFQIS